MYKKLKLDCADGGQKEFAFKAVASTPYYYRMIFREDILRKMSEVSNDGKTLNMEKIDTTMADKLAFVMNQQAEEKDMENLNFDDFLKWLDQFDGMAILNRSQDIMEIYTGQQQSTSEDKTKK